MKMWSGRFRQPLDSDFERWQRSFEFDRRLLSYELAASGAHARALKNAGILSADELISVLQGLEQIAERAAASPAFLEDQEAEDVHHFVEKQLAALIGETGYKLHSGRSRNEQIATDLRLYVRDHDRLRSGTWRTLHVFADRPKPRPMRRCRRIRICSERSRCWSRIGCWRTWRCSCATPTGWPIAASA